MSTDGTGLYLPNDNDQPPPTPAWARRQSRSRSSSSAGKRLGFARLHKVQRMVRRQIRKMSLWQRLGVLLFVIVGLIVTILGLAFHQKIFDVIWPLSQRWRELKAGWLILFAMCYLSAFPPMIGYSTTVTLAGFVYGFPKGWFVIASATIVGSSSAFVLCRYLLRDWTHRLISSDKRFAALSLTLKHDGIKLLCMIRLCPLPYSLGNGAVSTFPTVNVWAFMFATTVATPKLLIHVFIGSRLAVIAEQGGKMDLKTRLINVASIIFGIALGVVTGLLIYRRTVARAKVLEAEERSRLRQSIGTDGHIPNASFQDDPDERQAIRTVVDGMGDGEVGTFLANVFEDDAMTDADSESLDEGDSDGDMELEMQTDLENPH